LRHRSNISLLRFQSHDRANARFLYRYKLPQKLQLDTYLTKSLGKIVPLVYYRVRKLVKVMLWQTTVHTHPHLLRGLYANARKSQIVSYHFCARSPTRCVLFGERGARTDLNIDYISQFRSSISRYFENRELKISKCIALRYISRSLVKERVKSMELRSTSSAIFRDFYNISAYKKLFFERSSR